MKKYSIHRGTTLMELLVTIAIMGIICSTMWVVFVQGFKSYQLNKAQTEVQRDARIVLDLMERNLREAEADTIIISRYPDSTSTDNPPFSKITFTGLIKDTTAQISYYQTGRRFYQSVDGKDSIRASNVRNLSFMTVESGNNAVVTIGICLEQKTYSGKTRYSKLSFQKVRIMN